MAELTARELDFWNQFTHVQHFGMPDEELERLLDARKDLIDVVAARVQDRELSIEIVGNGPVVDTVMSRLVRDCQEPLGRYAVSVTIGATWSPVANDYALLLEYWRDDPPRGRLGEVGRRSQVAELVGKHAADITVRIAPVADDAPPAVTESALNRGVELLLDQTGFVIQPADRYSHADLPAGTTHVRYGGLDSLRTSDGGVVVYGTPALHDTDLTAFVAGARQLPDMTPLSLVQRGELGRHLVRRQATALRAVVRILTVACDALLNGVSVYPE